MTASLPQECLNIAILDDDKTYCSFIASLLSRQKDFVTFETVSSEALEQLLQHGHIDCILIDYDLGAESGFAVKQRLLERFRSLPPVVMFTGDERQSTAIKALRVGISDFLPKRGLTCETLTSSVVAAIERDRAERRSRAEHNSLSELAVRDPVTGFSTKAVLDSRLAQLAALPKWNGLNSHGLVAVAIQELPLVMETFGPRIAEQVLKAFAARLRSVLRRTDLCGRYVGDTFLIITDLHSESDEFKEMSKRLTEALSYRIDLDSIGIDLSACVRKIDCFEAVKMERNEAHDLGSIEGDSEPMRLLAEAPSSPASGSGARGKDRRREARHRVFKRGLIIIADLGATIDCTVRNVSDHGAGLRLDSPFAAPSSFELNIVGASARRRVRVRWQTGRDLGVEYED